MKGNEHDIETGTINSSIMEINHLGHRGNRFFAYAKTEAQISCVVTQCKADQRLCFLCTYSTNLVFLNPRFQTSSLLLWQHRPVCVRPGRNSPRPIFSRRGSIKKRCRPSSTTVILATGFDPLNHPHCKEVGTSVKSCYWTHQSQNYKRETSHEHKS